MSTGASKAIMVGELLERAELKGKVIAGHAGVGNQVTVPRIQKPGLALTGWPEQLHDGRVLVIGGTEIEYLADHETARTSGIATLMESRPACVVVCRGREAPAELREWAPNEEYDRLGFDDRHDDILGVQVAALRVPVRPGRNLATLVEVAARNQLLKLQGTHSAQAFRASLDRAMRGEVP